MAFFCTANGSFPGRCSKSFNLILSGVTKANQLEVFSKKNFKKYSLETKKPTFKNHEITDALDDHDMHNALHHDVAIVASIPCQLVIFIERIW